MEGEKKGNTAMLTVIAIATLLVAVVGATFAYFSASTTNTGNVTVQAETKAVDIFSATGNGDVEITVTNDKMQAIAGKNDYTAVADSDDDSTLVVSLEAGSGVATCTYNVVYTPDTTSPRIPYVATQNAYHEFGITGDSTINANDFSEVNITGSSAITLKTGASISDSAGSGATTETWTFTANYYNLEVDQSAAAGHTYGGTIAITDVSCTNAAS